MPSSLPRPLSALLLALLGFLSFASAALDFEPVGEGSASAPSVAWRVVNLNPVTYGWRIGELRLYSDSACTEDLTGPDSVTLTGGSWTALSSGAASAVLVASRAFDDRTWTEWRSQCYMCDAREAWIGVRFLRPVRVLCIKLWQWGEREYLSSSVELQRWAGDDEGRDSTSASWQGTIRGMGLAGERWDQLRFVLCEPLAAPEDGRVDFTNGRFFPSEATFSCSGARIYGGLASTATCNIEGKWSHQAGPCYSLLQIMIVFSICITLELIVFVVYYFRIILKRDPPLNSTSVVPEEEDRTWSFMLFRDFLKAPLLVPMLSCVCPCMRLADNWHSAGFVKYYIGVWLSQATCCFWPVIGMVLRPILRNRFTIKEPFKNDIFAWLCCCICAISQEGRQLDEMCELAEAERITLESEANRRLEREEGLRRELEARQQEKQASALKLGRSHGNEGTGHGHHSIVMIQSKSVLQVADML